MRVVNEREAFAVSRFATEADYEAFLLPRLELLFTEYWVTPFRLDVSDEGQYGVRRPDIALVSREYRDWIVVEVELAHHSLASHVYPQVAVFRSGEYLPRHAEYLADALPQVDPDRLRWLVAANQPEVLVIVDDAKVLERGWRRLQTDLGARLAVGTPLRSPRLELLLHYEGWLPLSSSIVSGAEWHALSGLLALDAPAAVVQEDQQEVTLLMNGRLTAWIARELADGPVLFPLDRATIQSMRQGSYAVQRLGESQLELVVNDRAARGRR